MKNTLSRAYSKNSPSQINRYSDKCSSNTSPVVLNLSRIQSSGGLLILNNNNSTTPVHNHTLIANLTKDIRPSHLNQKPDMFNINTSLSNLQSAKIDMKFNHRNVKIETNENRKQLIYNNGPVYSHILTR